MSSPRADGGNTKSKGVNGVHKKDETSQSNSAPPSVWKYQCLTPTDVTLAMTKLTVVEGMMERIWQEESALYEENMDIPSRESRTRRRLKVPRRNYATAQGTVQDPRLFPYHTACYPLLDAYDALYPDGLGQPRHYANAVPPSIHEVIDESAEMMGVLRRIMEEGEVPVPGYLGNSWNALLETFGGGLESTATVGGENGETLAEWRARLLSLHQVFDSSRWMQVRQYHADPKFWEHQVFGDTTMIQNVSNSTSAADNNPGLDVEHHIATTNDGERKYGLRCFPERSEDRFKILLRLIKHALSELQRDHRLAEVALHTIITAHGSDRVDVFQYLLIVLQSEYLTFCDGDCHARAQGNLEQRQRHGGNDDDDDEDDDEAGLYPDHFCSDWYNFHTLLPLIISGGITWMTTDHANVLAAFVRRVYDAAGTPDPFLEAEASSAASNPGAKQRQLLKQTIYYNRHTDWEDDEDNEQRPDDSGIPYDFIRDLILGLGAHARIDIDTLKQLKEQLVSLEDPKQPEVESGLVELMEKTALSYQNCIKALVDIGETSFRRLPANARSSEMCGCLVRALVMAFVPLERNQLDYSSECNYLRRLDSDLLDSIVSPKRYSDTITQATERFLERKSVVSSLDELITTITEPSNRVKHTIELVAIMLAQPPPDDVKDLIRALFARRVVEIRSSGCGYGDFLTWCRQPVDAADPLLFFHYFNYPAEDDNDEDDENDEEDSYVWEEDERGHQLTKREHWARYDFTLLALLRAWYSPWTRESHHSFSPAFRTAVRSLTLCAHRLGAPGDVAAYVSQFLHRDWFLDERMQCWHQDCLHQSAQNLYLRKFQQRGCALSIRGAGKNKSPSSFEYCSTCHVSMYCSPEHKQSDDKDGHKWCCGRPPWKAPLSSKEEELCLEVFALMETSTPDAAKEETAKHRCTNEVHISDLQQAEDNDGDDDADDEGSWESIDSNDDNQGPPSLTAVISKFFEKKVYKKQGW